MEKHTNEAKIINILDLDRTALNAWPRDRIVHAVHVGFRLLGSVAQSKDESGYMKLKKTRNIMHFPLWKFGKTTRIHKNSLTWHVYLHPERRSSWGAKTRRGRLPRPDAQNCFKWVYQMYLVKPVGCIQNSCIMHYCINNLHILSVFAAFRCLMTLALHTSAAILTAVLNWLNWLTRHYVTMIDYVTRTVETSGNALPC